MVTTSPGQAIADRARLERDLEHAGLPALKAFLADVARLAAGEDGRPFGPATVHAMWQTVVETMMAALPAGLSDDARANIRAMLDADRMPDRVFQVASDAVASTDPGTDLATVLADELGIPASLTAAGRRRSRVAKSFEDNPWTRRLRSTARTVTTAAQGRVEQAALLRGGFARKVWAARMDGHTRPSHLAANGQIVPTEQPFIVGGFPMMYPGDHTTAPPEETINCRCTMFGIPEDGTADEMSLPDEYPPLDDGTQVPFTRPNRPHVSPPDRARILSKHRSGANQSGKSMFPPDRSDDDIMDAIDLTVADPDTVDPGGDKLTFERRVGGVLVRVHVRVDGHFPIIWSAYPPEGKMPP